MLIRKLKLSGFKSFVGPAELRIEPGLTGVVGPNGCGKSNLLEAIRWVMGENSPKAMRSSGRSGGMDEVIFAGTEQRPARDFAEVVLEGVDEDGEALEVTRRIERGSGSAYRVNGRDARTRDVALVFADAATGAHSPALVSQGKIAQVIAARPAERRMMLEEAAGIAGLHVRRREAEARLRQTEANLARLEDLAAGREGQMASLRWQTRQAERYRVLSDRIRTAEAELLFVRWRDAAVAADAADEEAKRADAVVAEAHEAAQAAHKAQVAIAGHLATAREELTDRRDDGTAHAHRMATLAGQLETAEQRLADLARQRERLADDRDDADRQTADSAAALARLESALALALQALEADEARGAGLAERAEEADAGSREAELALTRAAADHAGLEAEWRVADAELAQAQERVERVEAEARRLSNAEAAPRTDDADQKLKRANAAAEEAGRSLSERREALATDQAGKEVLGAARDRAASKLATVRAELAGAEREWQTLTRDRDARAKRAPNGALPIALDKINAAPGFERALAAVLGRDGKAVLGAAPSDAPGRFWTGAPAPPPVNDSLATHVVRCPPELVARLALVHVVAADDGRVLAPGEWLVTRGGRLRRWDGFVADGEGAAEAAKLEADNRTAELESQLPALRQAAAEAQAGLEAAQAELSDLQRRLVADERDLHAASERERQALRALDHAEAERARETARAEERASARAALAGHLAEARAEVQVVRARRAALADPERGRSALAAAQARQEAARTAYQAALAALAANDQALAVARERTATFRADIAGWQARASEAATRLAQTARREEEVSEEAAVIAAKPAALMREIANGELVRARIAEELGSAEEAARTLAAELQAAEAAVTAAGEALSQARESRAGAAARSESAHARRAEIARISGERFQCPPPLLPGRFAFAAENLGSASDLSGAHERLIAERERIGPVNLVAADELARLEAEHDASVAERSELSEAVNRLRGSIGSLNREGRERLRGAFSDVDRHFRRLFGQLFDGGEAHLALIDTDDPLDAGLEIFAQPPGKRLQSLTLLSGGEQALTAIALIFALFLTNPAPICVLDEVDAPLDDASVERLCDLLDAMVAETDTRYLIVTHNAVTMSRMHRLFGVTMVERGISRLVSVDLGAAEQLLAAE